MGLSAKKQMTKFKSAKISKKVLSKVFNTENSKTKRQTAQI